MRRLWMAILPLLVAMSSLAIGNLGLAIGQVRLALEMPNVNSVDRSRYQARMNELLEYLPPEQRTHAAVGGH